MTKEKAEGEVKLVEYRDMAKDTKFQLDKYRTELEAVSGEIYKYKTRAEELAELSADLDMRLRQADIQLNTARRLREESEINLQSKIFKLQLEFDEARASAELKANTMNMVREDLVSRISDLENKIRREQNKLDLNIWKQAELKQVIEDKEVIIQDNSDQIDELNNEIEEMQNQQVLDREAFENQVMYSNELETVLYEHQI